LSTSPPRFVKVDAIRRCMSCGIVGTEKGGNYEDRVGDWPQRHDLAPRRGQVHVASLAVEILGPEFLPRTGRSNSKRQYC